MHMQERVDSDVGRQSWEQSPLLTLQGLVTSCPGGEGGGQRRGSVVLPGTSVFSSCCSGTVTAFTLGLVGVTTQLSSQVICPPGTGWL